MNPLDRPGLITPKDLAAYLQVSRAAICQWVKQGKIPYLKIEKAVRFYPEQIKEFLKSREKLGGAGE